VAVKRVVKSKKRWRRVRHTHTHTPALRVLTCAIKSTIPAVFSGFHFSNTWSWSVLQIASFEPCVSCVDGPCENWYNSYPAMVARMLLLTDPILSLLPIVLQAQIGSKESCSPHPLTYIHNFPSHPHPIRQSQGTSARVHSQPHCLLSAQQNPCTPSHPDHSEVAPFWRLGV
jgi:hypothetical protein